MKASRRGSGQSVTKPCEISLVLLEMKGKDRSQAAEDSKLADCPMCLRLGLMS